MDYTQRFYSYSTKQLYPLTNQRKELYEEMKPKPKVKKPRNAQSMSKKQQGLSKVVLSALAQLSSIYGIFLVRQGLKARTEQIITLAITRGDAEWFCRNYLTPKFCRENESLSLKFHNPETDESLNVNKDSNHLMIKGIDFNRRESGRTNQNPLWYLNIAEITIVNKQLIINQQKEESNGKSQHGAVAPN